MKVVLKAENSSLDLHWILDLITTLWTSATVNSSVTLALLSANTNIVRICSPFLRLWHLSCCSACITAFSACSNICIGKASVTEWAWTWNGVFCCKWTVNTWQMYCCRLGLLKLCCTHQIVIICKFLRSLVFWIQHWVFLVHKGSSLLLIGISIINDAGTFADTYWSQSAR